jgi:hypothetical protein
MGHIVFAAPSIRRFHLHERLRRDLLRRDHRVSVLCCERTSFTFWREQVAAVDLLATTRGDAPDANMQTLLQQVTAGDERRRLARLLPAATRWLERERPDLVLFHGERSATTAALQFAARTVGCPVLWTGDGLLPHTMQVDDRGLDADAGSRRWQARDYRVVAPDDALLDASLAHALSGGEPLALPRAEVHVPMVSRRLLDALCYGLEGRFAASLHALHGWQAAFADVTPRPPVVPVLDLRPPFVAVLLQADDDPRLVHDGQPAPSPAELVQQALAAAARLDPDATVVAALPPRCTERRWGPQALAGAAGDRVRIVPAGGAAVAAATAAAVVTVNHPMATAALLAGTPVLHTGRALYELPGVTHATTPEGLPDALAAASGRDRPALRRRLLSWHLRHGHVWCSPTAPNHNGMLGLVEAVEKRLAAAGGAESRPLPYRPGPTWPLATS